MKGGLKKHETKLAKNPDARCYMDLGKTTTDFNLGAVTCMRPNSRIYDLSLCRFITGPEALSNRSGSRSSSAVKSAESAAAAAVAAATTAAAAVER